jgi:flagellar hook-length control protein FliK
VAPVMEDVTPLVMDLDPQPTAPAPLPKQETAMKSDDTPAMPREKTAPVTQAPLLSIPKKPITAGRLADAFSLQAVKQADDDPAPAASDRTGAQGTQNAVTTHKEEVKPGEADVRLPLPPPVVTRESTPVEREDRMTHQQVVVAKPVQAKVEVPEEPVPVTPPRTEEVPAKAVVAIKGAVETGAREGDASKNTPQNGQSQLAPVKLESVRGESGPSRLSEFLSSLPPETARSVVDQVVKEAALQVRGETSEMRIKLVPASLGEVTINVRMERGQMQAQIDVTHAGVKTALESNMGQLRDALSSRGIDVQQLDVHFGGQSMARDAAGDQSDRYRRQGSKRHAAAVDAIEQYDTGRMLGYNTMEMVM